MDKLSLHGLTQFYVKLEEVQKTRKLTDLMDVLEFNQVIIFVRDKKRAHSLNKILQESKFPSIELHSDMEVTERYVNIRLYAYPLAFFYLFLLGLDDGSGWLRIDACRCARAQLDPSVIPRGAGWPPIFP